jgi:hypothetical protein
MAGRRNGTEPHLLDPPDPCPWLLDVQALEQLLGHPLVRDKGVLKTRSVQNQTSDNIELKGRRKRNET